MRRRKLLVGLVMGALVLLVAGAFVPRTGPNLVTLVNYARIREGMNRAEVEAILGPAGDYRTGPTQIASIGQRYFVTFRADDTWHEVPLTMWRSDRAIIGVGFGSSGLVEQKCCDPDCRLDQSALDDLRWRAERQWRRWFPE